MQQVDEVAVDLQGRFASGEAYATSREFFYGLNDGLVAHFGVGVVRGVAEAALQVALRKPDKNDGCPTPKTFSLQ